MREISTKTAVWLIIILFIAGVAISSLLYDLKEQLPDFNVSWELKIAFAGAVFLLALFIFSNHKFNPVLWFKGLVVILIFWFLLAIGNGLVFFFFLNRDSFVFLTAFRNALFDYTPTFLFQIILSPCLAYPILIESLSTDDEDILSSPIEEPDRVEKSIGPPEQKASPPPEPFESWREVPTIKEKDLILDSTQGIPVPFLHGAPGIVDEKPEESDEIQIEAEATVELPVSGSIHLEEPEAVGETEEILGFDLDEVSEELDGIPKLTEIAVTIPKKPAPQPEEAEPVIERIPEKEEAPTENFEPKEKRPISSVAEVKGQEIAGLDDLLDDLPAVEMQIAGKKEEITAPEEPILTPEKVKEFTESHARKDEKPQVSEPEKPPQKPKKSPKAPESKELAKDPSDKIHISIRKIIKFNKDSEGGEVLDKLIRKGSDHLLKIPLRMFVSQLLTGKVTLTVEGALTIAFTVALKIMFLQ